MRDVLKNINLFVDGRGHAGEIDEYNAPDLSLTTEDYRGGGMDAPTAIEMGMEALETSFSLISYSRDVLRLFGISEGNEVPLTVRGALQSDDGTVKPVIHKMRGKITTLSSGAWQPGSKPTLTITMRLDYYKHEHDGVLVHEIDVKNMVRVVDGQDLLADFRDVLGI